MPYLQTGSVESFEVRQLKESDDPDRLLAQLREAGPLLRTTAGFWTVTGYECANSMLRDTRFASGPIAELFRQTLPPGAAREELGNRINFLDKPDHTRVRRLVMGAFTPKRVQEMRPWIEQETERLLDGITVETVDIRAALAHQLPSLVISEMLGVPVEDRDRLAEWTEIVTPLLSVEVSEDDKERAIDASEKFADYAEELIEQRRRNLGDDLLSAMLRSQEGEEQLSRAELLSLFVTLYSAGHRTTRDLFSNGLYTLLQHPEQYAQLVEDPSLCSSVVREFLRFCPPTIYVARVTAEEVELLGQKVPASSAVLIFLTAANRDPQQFSDPNRFDIHRDEGRPLSFAVGPHHCLGSSLAQIEVEAMLAAVVARWPELELAAPEPNWWMSGPFHGLDQLCVRTTN